MRRDDVAGPLAPAVSRLDGGVQLWVVDIDSGAGQLMSFGERYGLAAPEGRGGIDRQRRAAHMALRLLLAGYVGLEAAARPFAHTPAGKPSLASFQPGGKPTLHFNLAHCDGSALIAVSAEGPVGVDVEGDRRPRISEHRQSKLIEAARIVAPLDALPDGPAEARFLQAWVRLEALAKATGEGLGALLARLDKVILAGHPGAGLVVRDVHIDGRRLWAAVSGADSSMKARPSPVARAMPLDDAWLDDWVKAAPASHPLPSGIT